jgi:3',5'-cyclic-AMP phosphodiesterase
MQNLNGQDQAKDVGQEGVMGRALRLIQITDTHLYRSPSGVLLGLNTQDSFDKVVRLVASQQTHPDMIVATGDIAQDASEEAYQRFAETVSTLNAPFYWIPGNHDRRSVMSGLAAYADAFTPCVRMGNWQIIMLDSSHPGDVHGVLAESELDVLKKNLVQAGAGKPIEHSLICLHHNPIPGTAGWMQDIGLHNADEFIDVLRQYDSVRAVTYGHIHQTLDLEHEGIRYFCTPSTCIQFRPHVEDFELDLLSPAYRWFDLNPDGSIVTQVERLQNYDIRVDRNAGGY